MNDKASLEKLKVYIEHKKAELQERKAEVTAAVQNDKQRELARIQPERHKLIPTIARFAEKIRKNKNAESIKFDLPNLKKFINSVHEHLGKMDQRRIKSPLKKYARLLQIEADIEDKYNFIVEHNLQPFMEEIEQLQAQLDTHPETVARIKEDAEQRNLARVNPLLKAPKKFMQDNINQIITLYAGGKIDKIAFINDFDKIEEVLNAVPPQKYKDKFINSLEDFTQSLQDRIPMNNWIIEGCMEQIQIYDATNQKNNPDYQLQHNQLVQKQNENEVINEIVARMNLYIQHAKETQLKTQSSIEKDKKDNQDMQHKDKQNNDKKSRSPKSKMSQSRSIPKKQRTRSPAKKEVSPDTEQAASSSSSKPIGIKNITPNTAQISTSQSPSSSDKSDKAIKSQPVIAQYQTTQKPKENVRKLISDYEKMINEQGKNIESSGKKPKI